MKRAGLTVIALAGLCLAAEPAKADVITFDFTLKGSFSQGGLNNGATRTGGRTCAGTPPPGDAAHPVLGPASASYAVRMDNPDSGCGKAGC